MTTRPASYFLFGVALANDNSAADVAVKYDVIAVCAEHHVNAVLHEPYLYIVVKLLRFFRSEMADRAVYELEARFYGVLSDLFDLVIVADALYVGIRTELKINLIGVIYELLRKIRAYKIGQIAAHLVGERKLSVGESARTGKTGGYAAAPRTVDAVPDFRFGTVTLFNGEPFSIRRIFCFEPRRSISIAVNIPAGPAPTMIRSY